MYSGFRGASVKISTPARNLVLAPDRLQELREELARRIAAYVGSEQKADH